MKKLTTLVALVLLAACEGPPPEADSSDWVQAGLTAEASMRGRTPRERRVPVTPRLSQQAQRVWERSEATTHEVDLAHAMDVCRCPNMDCVRGLQGSYYERRRKAKPAAPAPADVSAVRKMRVDCAVRLSREAYQLRAGRPAGG
jgi:hypothetical protein